MEQPLSASIEKNESVVLLLSLRLRTLSIYFRRIRGYWKHYSLAQCCLEDSEVKTGYCIFRRRRHFYPEREKCPRLSEKRTWAKGVQLAEIMTLLSLYLFFGSSKRELSSSLRASRTGGSVCVHGPEISWVNPAFLRLPVSMSKLIRIAASVSRTKLAAG